MLKKAAQRAERMEDDAARRAEARMAQLGRLEALREEVIAHLRSALETVAERYDGGREGAVIPIRPKQ